MKYIVFKPCIVIVILLLVSLDLPVIWIYVTKIDQTDKLIRLIFFAIVIVFSIGKVYYYFQFFVFFKLMIADDGVSFRRYRQIYTLQWTEINCIGIASNNMGFYNRYCFIYFDGRSSDFPLNPLKFSDYNPLFFGVQYRRKIIREIQKHWTKPIISIYQVEG